MADNLPDIMGGTAPREAMPVLVVNQAGSVQDPALATLGSKGDVLTPGAGDIAGFAAMKGIVCLTAGDITIVPTGNADGVTLSFVGCPVGFVPPYRVRKLTAATATVASVYDG